jgi:hypothetical protein
LHSQLHKHASAWGCVCNGEFGFSPPPFHSLHSSYRPDRQGTPRNQRAAQPPDRDGHHR